MNSESIFWQARILKIESQDNSDSNKIEVTVEFKNQEGNSFQEKFVRDFRGRHGVREEFLEFIQRIQGRLEDMDKLKENILSLAEFIGVIITQNGVVKAEDTATHFELSFDAPLLK